MFDIKLIHDNQELVEKGLLAKKSKTNLSSLIRNDCKRKELSAELDQLRNQKNLANDEISQLFKAKKDPKKKIAAMKKISSKISALEPQVKKIQQQVQAELINIPNLPHPSVPIGGPQKNQTIREWGEPAKFDFAPQTHIDLAQNFDMIDFKGASKISGSNFVFYKGAGARLERALFNFMLDVHTSEHGYTEVFPPFLVNRQSMIGTGQLPKMEEDMYQCKEDDLFLIPTAEVPVTNIHRDEVLQEQQLPIYYTAYTACFRREAGSYGKDTRGLMRVHQFDKVELVKFVKPENSYDELESLVENAETILQLLELPYRIRLLASEELSFAAAKCYDIEVYAPGVDRWLEVSSCSHFEDFQARRANIRFKSKDLKRPNFVHTLNGSGVALARTMLALIEHNQTKEGDIHIPKILQPFMGGLKKISKT